VYVSRFFLTGNLVGKYCYRHDSCMCHSDSFASSAACTFCLAVYFNPALTEGIVTDL